MRRGPAILTSSSAWRCVQNLALRRIDQPEREILLGYLLRDRLSRDDEHLLRHPGSLGGKHRHTHRREDVNIVSLSSRPEGSHLRALPDPYVNLSIHTARS